jgi:hypothetical protein
MQLEVISAITVMQYRDIALQSEYVGGPSLSLLPLMLLLLLLLQVMMIAIHLTAARLSFRLVSVLYGVFGPPTPELYSADGYRRL